MPDPRIWTPAAARARARPRNIDELEAAIPGPDERFRDHRAGCDCGDLDCPWYRGEVAARRYASMSEGERVGMAREAVVAMQADAVPFL